MEEDDPANTSTFTGLSGSRKKSSSVGIAKNDKEKGPSASSTAEDKAKSDELKLLRQKEE